MFRLDRLRMQYLLPIPFPGLGFEVFREERDELRCRRIQNNRSGLSSDLGLLKRRLDSRNGGSLLSGDFTEELEA